eukprot:COSAG06_NODE_4164_length_4509_cov_3.151701_2_plen_55_part_00
MEEGVQHSAHLDFLLFLSGDPDVHFPGPLPGDAAPEPEPEHAQPDADADATDAD